MSKNEVIQVCKTNCDNKPFKAKVKKKNVTFCCEKGFNQSLVDFLNFLK